MNPQNKKFLIIKLSSLGDVVHTLPVLRTLRKNYPGATIAWMVEERYRELLEGNPDLDRIIPVRTKHWRKNWNLGSLREILEVLRTLRRLRFDTVFDLHGLLKSGLIALLSGSRNRVGFSAPDCREKVSALFTNRKGPGAEPGTHIVDRYLSLVSATQELNEVSREFPIQIPPRCEETIQDFLKTHPDLTSKPVVGINPGAGFETKQWSLDRFAELADRLTNEIGCSILLTWGPGEEGMVKHIAGRAAQKCWTAPPTTIIESAALYRRLALLVSCDSGPLHLGAALGVPTVSIFGPTDPARNGAYGDRHQAVYKTLSCSFCWKKKCPLKTKECMELITVEEVFEAVKKSFAHYVKVIAS